MRNGRSLPGRSGTGPEIGRASGRSEARGQVPLEDIALDCLIDPEEETDEEAVQPDPRTAAPAPGPVRVEAKAPRGVRLVVMVGKLKGQSLGLPDGRLLIGRDICCHIRPSSRSVSRVHAVVEEREDGVYVRDLNSSNGTLLNNHILKNQEMLVHEGDRLRIGPLLFTLVSAQPVLRLPARSVPVSLAGRRTQAAEPATAPDLPLVHPSDSPIQEEERSVPAITPPTSDIAASSADEPAAEPESEKEASPDPNSSSAATAAEAIFQRQSSPRRDRGPARSKPRRRRGQLLRSEKLFASLQDLPARGKVASVLLLVGLSIGIPFGIAGGSRLPKNLTERCVFVVDAYSRQDARGIRRIADPQSRQLVSEWLTDGPSLPNDEAIEARFYGLVPHQKLGTAGTIVQVVPKSQAREISSAPPAGNPEELRAGEVLVTLYWKRDKSGEWLFDVDRTLHEPATESEEPPPGPLRSRSRPPARRGSRTS